MAEPDWLRVNWRRWGAEDQRGTLNYITPEVTQAAARLVRLELLDLERLATDRVHEFMFLAAPLRITGGLGSPLNPLAVS